MYNVYWCIGNEVCLYSTLCVLSICMCILHIVFCTVCKYVLSICKKNFFNFFCTVCSTLVRISLTKALVLWGCDNKSDLIWFDRMRTSFTGNHRMHQVYHSFHGAYAGSRLINRLHPFETLCFILRKPRAATETHGVVKCPTFCSKDYGWKESFHSWKSPVFRVLKKGAHYERL